MTHRARSWVRLAVAGLAMGCGLAAVAAAQMPDIGQMSGVPLPSGELPAGAVSVRVVRGDLTNNVVGQPVELHGAGADRRAVTDESGRAVFDGVPAGAAIHALAIVDGERLESQSFTMPAQGGMRVILVSRATTSGAPPAAAEGTGGGPSAGAPGFGGQSRLVVELADAAVDVYYLLDLANPPGVAAGEPLVITPPEGATGLTVLEGSSPAAKADGGRFVVSGPLPPGVNSVQLAYQLPYAGPEVAITQRFPLALAQLALFVRKVGDLRLASPQVASQREMQADGNAYIAASGAGVPAGAPVEIVLSGLPYRSSWPRYVALGLAGLIVLGGIGLSVGHAGEDAAARRRDLDAQREALLGELVRLEEQRLTGRADAARHAARREATLARLERVYAELDSGDAAFRPLSTAVPEPEQVRAG
jgi:hypothetical protein